MTEDIDTQPIVQDLSQFRSPPGFRGKSVFVVQLWWIVQAILFRPSPQFMFGWRRFLLRLFGAEIEDHVLIRPGVKTTYPWRLKVGRYSWIGDGSELYSLGSIEIGRHVAIAQDVKIVAGTHDFRKQSFDILARSIKIEDECWLCAGSFIHPGLVLGRGSVIGARAVVLNNTEPFSVNAGFPATKIGSRVPMDIGA